MKVLVSDAAGFTDDHVARFLCERGDWVVGIANLNDCYQPAIKLAHLEQLRPFTNFSFQKLDTTERQMWDDLIADVGLRPATSIGQGGAVCHLVSFSLL